MEGKAKTMQTQRGVDDGLPAVSVLITYFNEDAFLENTLNALARQDGVLLHFILVNNASNDSSPEIAKRFAETCDKHRVVLVEECEPGRVRALETGARYIDAPWVTICDADTLYPPHYLKTAVSLMQRAGIDGAFAFNASQRDRGLKHWWRSFARGWLTPLLLRRQCHSGGYGQTYRSAALKQAGSYSVVRWPYVLEDHEIAHRVLQNGAIAYSPALYCFSNLDRRSDRSNVSWTVFERLLYHVVPFAAKDWFFYRFLARRFQRRGQSSLKLRDQSWNVPSDRA